MGTILTILNERRKGMAGWTLEEAKIYLKAWLDAELAVTTGQSYKLEKRELTRANLSEIKDRINFWRREVESLESGRRRKRIFRVVPRDL